MCGKRTIRNRILGGIDNQSTTANKKEFDKHKQLNHQDLFEKTSQNSQGTIDLTSIENVYLRKTLQIPYTCNQNARQSRKENR